MRTLVAKDFRLAADALRPLAAIIAGLVVIIIGLGFVPASLAPSILREFDLALAFQFVALTTLGLSGLIAAWVTASVVLGDRLHRAGAFEASVPVSNAGRWTSKAIAIAASCAIIVALGAVTAFLTHPRRPGPMLPGNWPELAGFVALTSAIGIALAAGVSRAVRRVELVVAVVVGIAIVAAFVGAVGGSIGASTVTSMLLGDGERFMPNYFLDQTDGASVLANARSLGIATAALAAAVILGLARGRLAPTSRGRAFALAAVTVVAALASGTAAGWVSANGSPAVIRGRAEASQLIRIMGMSDEQLASTAADYVSHATENGRQAEYAFRMNEIARRLNALSDEAFDQSPLAASVLRVARSGKPGSEAARSVLMRWGSRDLRLPLEFASMPNGDALLWGRLAATNLLTDEAAERTFNEAMGSAWQAERATELVVGQLEAAADRGHPMAKELRAAAANLRSQAAKDPTP